MHILDSNQPRQIREKAVLKIKSKPGWEDDLYKALDTRMGYGDPNLSVKKRVDKWLIKH